ncbi:MAG TPA: TetR/AcrR family transcriptional regulator [Acidimicrobiales bacterium]
MTARRSQGGDADATRRDILRAAGSLFLERGYAATTTRSVAREVGLTPAAAVHHFGRKHELYLAVTESIQWEVYEIIEGIVDQRGALIDKIEQILRIDEHRTGDEPGYLRFLSSVGMETSLHPELVPALSQVPFDELFGRLVADGVASGEVSAEQGPLLIRALRVLLAGIGLSTWDLPGAHSPADACVALVRGLLILPR